MAGASLKVDLTQLNKLIERFSSGPVRQELENLPKAVGVAALISQAIADNFDKEGPGWQPLSGYTLRKTVGKAQLRDAQKHAAYVLGALKVSKKTGKTSINKKALKGQMANFHERTEKLLVRQESQIRKYKGEVGRMILQDTGLLKKVATTPAVTANNKKGAKGTNTYRVQGTTVFWGVDLTYAGIHNRGGIIKSKSGKERRIPKREFLVVREEWMVKLRAYIKERAIRIIQQAISRGY